MTLCISITGDVIFAQRSQVAAGVVGGGGGGGGYGWRSKSRSGGTCVIAGQ